MRIPKHSLRLILFAIVTAVVVRWCVIQRVTAIRKVLRVEPVRAHLLRVSYPALNSNRHHVFGDLEAVVDSFPVSLTGPGKPEKLLASAVTARFFQRIGVEPVMGRAFSATDGAYGHPHVVILSHQFWRRHFCGSTQVLGSKIKLGGEPYRVIGILPSDFTWNNGQTDVWVPAAAETGRDLEPAI